MSETDFRKLGPAFDFLMRGHQNGFRVSTDPFTTHPLTMAIYAADTFQADWQTIALCLLHDLAEDSSEHGENITPKMVKDAYKKLGEDVHDPSLREDGILLALGMRDLKEIDAPTKERKGKRKASIGTIAKIYDSGLHRTFPGRRYKKIRAPFVKLLDRLHNMRTIGFMPEDKKRAKATETLQIYVRMAEAFGLRELREDLAFEALLVLHPDDLKSIWPVYEDLKHRLPDIHENTFIPMGKNDEVNSYLRTPSLYELWKQFRKTGQIPVPYFNLEIVLQSVKSGKSGLFAAGAKKFIQDFMNTAGKQNAVLKTDLVDRTLTQDYALRPEAVVAINGTDYHVRFYTPEESEIHRATLRHFVSESTKEQKKALRKRLDQVNKRYDSLRSGDLSTFYETIEGDMILYDADNQAYFFPNEATPVDVLFTLFQNSIRAVESIDIRDAAGNIHFIFLDGHWGNHRFSAGDQIIGVYPGRERSPDETVNFPHYATLPSVREALYEQLESDFAQYPEMATEIVSAGKLRVREELEKHNSTGIIQIPVQYESEDLFFLDAGLGRVSYEQIRLLTHEQEHFGRSRVIFEQSKTDQNNHSVTFGM